MRKTFHFYYTLVRAEFYAYSFIYLIIWDKVTFIIAPAYHLESISRLQCGEKRTKERRKPNDQGS